MICCKHPDMEGDCFHGKKICCRHCDQIDKCIELEEGVCPFIYDKNDLNVECSFEKEMTEEEKIKISIENFTWNIKVKKQGELYFSEIQKYNSKNCLETFSEFGITPIIAVHRLMDKLEKTNN
jgi:hypothetical protein